MKLLDRISAWLAKQPGVDHIEMKLSCPACTYRWTKTVDLTKTSLSDAIRQVMRCEMCGSEKVRVEK